ncbi:MFS transporter [Kribbella solani]|uniref:MFS transporter n=1 Tax=Kribbella solani TaxID=236067 RepID=UPI0029BCD75F|nr:MFS transporter [Kribbella solani]MDX2972670.1 MFS transporter [Kribbella solani]MDX3001665.1 MFS transporter [Kribbella solani]
MKEDTGLPREVSVLATMAFIVAVGFGVQSPALPVFAENLGVGSAAVGALVSAFALMRLVSGPLGGRFVNAVGEIRVLITGMFMLATTSVIAGLSTSFPQLLIMRGLGGIGSALYSVAAMSLVFRVTPRHLTGRAVGIFQGAFYSGTVIGPAIGGLMSGLSPRVPFFAYGGAAALGGVVAVIFLRRMSNRRPADDERSSPAVGLRTAIRHYPYRAAVTANFTIGWAVFGVRVSVLPLYLLNVVKAPAVWIGVGLSACAVVQALTLPVAGRRADRWPARRPLVLGETVIILGFLAILLGASVPTYLVGLALLGLGVSFVTTGGSKLVAGIATGRAGVVVAIYQSGADAGMVVGPLITGLLADHFGYPTALTTTITILTIGLTMSAFIRPRPADPT